MISALPQVALSIRQPWAWLIVNGFKDIENRDRCIKHYTGPVLIHASGTMTKSDYEACELFLLSNPALDRFQKFLPSFEELREQLGGIVGSATIDAHGTFKYNSPWWCGPYAYRLIEAAPLPIQRCKGQLGFFPCIYKP